MTQEELKPCPFCGEIPERFNSLDALRCGKCQKNSGWMSRKEWNTRTANNELEELRGLYATACKSIEAGLDSESKRLLEAQRIEILQQKTAKENTKELLDDAIRMLEERNKELEEWKITCNARSDQIRRQDKELSELRAKVKRYAEKVAILTNQINEELCTVSMPQEKLIKIGDLLVSILSEGTDK